MKGVCRSTPNHSSPSSWVSWGTQTQEMWEIANCIWTQIPLQVVVWSLAGPQSPGWSSWPCHSKWSSSQILLPTARKKLGKRNIPSTKSTKGALHKSSNEAAPDSACHLAYRWKLEGKEQARLSYLQLLYQWVLWILKNLQQLPGVQSMCGVENEKMRRLLLHSLQMAIWMGKEWGIFFLDFQSTVHI